MISGARGSVLLLRAVRGVREPTIVSARLMSEYAMFSLRASRAVKSATGLLLCASLLIAQQPPTATPNSPPVETVFSVTTALVQVDAVVTDSKGHYITGLAPDDFAIYEDGKPQKITNFSYVRVSAPPVPPLASAGPPPPAPAAPLHREDVRRTIVLMVDDLGLSFESMAYVHLALEKFVERQMQAGDLVAICRTGSGSGTLQQFTTDKRILLSVIKTLRWNPNGRAALSFFEPYGKYSRLANQIVGGNPNGPNGAAGSLTSSYEAGRNTIFTVGTLGAINYIVSALREMPGRKSIVLFSDGLQLFTPGQGPVRHTGLNTSQTTGSNSEVLVALRRLVDRANRASTVIYTIQAGGLQTLQPDAQDRIELGGMSSRDAQNALNDVTHVGVVGGRDFDFNAGEQGLADLALETGGIPYANGNDMSWGLDRVLEDQQGYYLIGFKPASDTFEEKHGSRSYHRVTVRVVRAGLHVRSRTGFFGETDNETMPKYATPLDQMRVAMLSPFRSSDLRLRLTALYAEAPRRGPVVRNLLYIDTADLTFPTHEVLNLGGTPGPSAQIEIVAMATSLGDVPVATVARSFTLQARAGRFEEAVKEGALYTLDVPIKKRGAYQIRVAVRDTVTGRVGSASQFLEIPELKKGRVALTSIILQNGVRPAGAPDWTGMSPATRQFQQGSEIEYFCLIENAGKKVPVADLDSQIRIVRDGKDVYAGPAKLVPIDGGGLALTGRLKLAGKMTPGHYDMQIVARDRTTPKNGAAAQWTDFEIKP